MSSSIINVDKLSKCYNIRRGPVTSGSKGGGYRRFSEDLLSYPRNLLRYLVSRGRQNNSLSEDFWALDDVSFEINEGEVVGIVGSNGAGKSTLLKVLSRITEPTSGRVTLRGRVASLLEVGTGFHPELTGRENVFLNGAILGMTKAEIRSKFDEIVEFANVGRFIDTPVKRFSSGMYVRLAFSVAAHLEPEILFVDEVLSVGDASFQDKCLGKMRDVANMGRTLLFVSHNLGAVRQLCRRSILLNGGRVEAQGPTEDVLDVYLRSQGAATRLGRFQRESNESQPFQLLEAFAGIDPDTHREQFSCDEDVLIVMRFAVRKRVPGLFGYCEISSSDGTIVMMVDSMDSGSNPLDGLNCGEHVLLMRIPRRTLGHGEYRVLMAFTSRTDETRDDPGIVATFRLVDETTWRGNSRGGMLSVITTWEVIADRPVAQLSS